MKYLVNKIIFKFLSKKKIIFKLDDLTEKKSSDDKFAKSQNVMFKLQFLKVYVKLKCKSELKLVLINSYH